MDPCENVIGSVVGNVPGNVSDCELIIYPDE